MPSRSSVVDDSSPSASSIALPLSPSRRDSKGSSVSRSALDQETLSLALDQIHNTALRSDALITFGECANTPHRTVGGEGKGIAGDLVYGGISGLYSRIKASVGAAKDVVVGQTASKIQDSPDHGSIASAKSKAAASTTKSSVNTNVSSPITASASSSRIQSPLTSNFPKVEPSLPQSSKVGSASSFNNPTEQVQQASLKSQTQTETTLLEGPEPVLNQIPTERIPRKGSSGGQQLQSDLTRPDAHPPFRPPMNTTSSSGIFQRPHRQEDAVDLLEDLSDRNDNRVPEIGTESRTSKIDGRATGLT